MARGRSGGGSRSGGGRSGGSRSSSRSSFSSSRSSSRSFSSSRSSLGGGSSLGGSSRSSSWSRSGSSGSFSHSRPTSGGSGFSRSAVSRPAGSFTSHKPDPGRPAVIRQKPGIPTGSYTHRRPIGGSIFGGGNIFVGGNIFGGGNFSGNYSGNGNSSTYTEPASDTGTAQEPINGTAQDTQQTAAQNMSGSAGTAQQSAYNGTASNTGKRNSGCLSSVFTVGVWCIILLVLFSMVNGAFGGNSNQFTKSTVKREKLALNLSDAAGYYTDECGWIDNRTKLEKGLKDFYDNTGILPYVYIIDNVAGDYDPSTEKLEQFAEESYEELFDDGGHALLVFWEYSYAYEYVLWLGEDAAELMDTEACDILFDYLDYYYYEDVSDEEFFANAFTDAGERMMQVNATPAQIFTVFLGIAAVLIAVYVLYKRHKAHKAKEAERKKRAEEILNSPLEKFGENGDIIDELEKKYEKEI